MDFALGMIETRGLVGSIEAADVMLKTANVRLLGKEVVRDGLVTIEIFGEVAAVKASVEAGALAAGRVGELVSQHVIPRPMDDIDIILAGQTESTPDPVPETVSPKPASSARTTPARPAVAPASSPASGEDLDAMTVHQLRTIAREIPGLGIQGRQISKANKQVLILEIRKARNA
jgi:ethanolamine utilization protein EutM